MMPWIRTAIVALFCLACLMAGVMYYIPQFIESMKWWGIL